MEASDLHDLINIIDGDPVLRNAQPEDFHDFIVDEDAFNYVFLMVLTISRLLHHQ